MDDWTKKFLGYATAYAIVGFLTYGLNYNQLEARYQDCGPEPNILEDRIAWRAWQDCETGPMGMEELGVVYSGLFWPVYWAGKSAILITSR